LNSQRRASAFSKLHIAQQALASLLALVLLFATYPQSLVAQDQQASAQALAATYIQETREQLEQLVAPIALYPDSLVAQILAASSSPPTTAALIISSPPIAPGRTIETSTLRLRPFDQTAEEFRVCQRSRADPSSGRRRAERYR
jgi:hypothetical protein